MKVCPNVKIFAEVGSQFCQILNNYSRNGQRLFKFRRSRENFAKSGHTKAVIAGDQTRPAGNGTSRSMGRKLSS